MTAAWSSMIRACVRNEQFWESLSLFRSMLRAGHGGDGHAIAAAAKACGRRRHLRGGGGLHGHAVAVGLEGDAFVKTSLLDMYSRCSALELARRLFDEMPLRNLATWNAMISACARNGEVNAAFDLLGRMRVNGLGPNLSTFLGLLSGGVLPHQSGCSLHCYGFKLGLTSELTFANSLIAVYSKGGWVNAAVSLFESMGERSAASWTALAGGFVNAGDYAGALEIFNRMRRSGLPLDEAAVVGLLAAAAASGDRRWVSAAHALAVKSGFSGSGGGGISTANSLVSCYCKCGDLPAAERVFLSIPEQKDVFSWTAMIAGYAENGGAAEALILSEKMAAAGVNPSEATVLVLLSACGELGSPAAGRRVAELASTVGFAGGRRVRTALIHMYSKCGDIDRAREVFSQISGKDLALWSCMVNGYAMNGRGQAAIELFEEMTAEGVDPDGAVFTSLLSACRHAGMVEEGLTLFNRMTAEFQIEPTGEHYVCLADLLERGGHRGAALRAAAMAPPGEFRAAAMRAAGAAGAAEEESCGEKLAAFKRLAEMGRWEEAAHVRRAMEERGLVKEPGWSRVEDEDDAALVDSESLSGHTC